MQMRLQHIDPHPLLKGYIEKMWIFESSCRVPNYDMKLIVPNGCVKLVVPYKNGLSGKYNGWFHLSKEHSITLIGVSDIPAIVDSENDSPAGTIGIEFNQIGSYRFFHLRQVDIKNKIHPLIDILGTTAKRLEEQISNAESIRDKVFLLQQFLLKLLAIKDEDAIFDYCVRKINLSKGKITVKELENETGYSSRWLNIKFIDRVGISPKNLASIIRFQQFYQSMVNNTGVLFMQREFYDYYYDQSHFIKEFKRFTGVAPTKFMNSTNDFGKIFYKE